MCCLTIVKSDTNEVVVTHNRDEQWSRQSTATQVQESIINHKKTWMPIDGLSGGTWIGTDGARVVAILNGFRENHIKKPKYRESRGSIIPQFFRNEGVASFLNTFDPTGLEPFTLISIDENKSIIEIGWDERSIHLSNKSSEVSLIYSSSTLYGAEIRDKRKSIFKSRLDKQMDHHDLWEFHENKGTDLGGFINVDYNDQISTVAISQIVIGDTSVFHYQSLLNNNSKQSILLVQ